MQQQKYLFPVYARGKENKIIQQPTKLKLRGKTYRHSREKMLIKLPDHFHWIPLHKIPSHYSLHLDPHNHKLPWAIELVFQTICVLYCREKCKKTLEFWSLLRNSNSN